MRLLVRWMLNALAVLSLLLCVATVVMWVRSYHTRDIIEPLAGPPYLRLDSAAGWPSFMFVADQGTIAYRPHWGTLRGSFSMKERGKGANCGPNQFGFALYVLRTTAETRPNYSGWRHSNRLIVIAWAPYWSIFLVTLVMPALRMRKIFRGNRQAGHCPKCSYNLHGNVSGVCPECGTNIDRPSA